MDEQISCTKIGLARRKKLQRFTMGVVGGSESKTEQLNLWMTRPRDNGVPGLISDTKLMPMAQMQDKNVGKSNDVMRRTTMRRRATRKRAHARASCPRDGAGRPLRGRFDRRWRRGCGGRDPTNYMWKQIRLLMAKPRPPDHWP